MAEIAVDAWSERFERAWGAAGPQKEAPPPLPSLVLERLEHVQARRPPRREHGREDADEDRRDHEDGDVEVRHREDEALARELGRDERGEDESDRDAEGGPDQR